MREGQVIDHRKESLKTIGDFFEDSKLKESFELPLKKRLGVVRDGYSEKLPHEVFPKAYSIGIQMGYFVTRVESIPGARIRFHHSLLNRSAYENWSIYYIKEVLEDNKVMNDLVTRIQRSFGIREVV